MQLTIRIKASEEFRDIFALMSVGGKITEGPYPKFEFHSNAQRDEYDRLRRRLEAEDGRDGVHQDGTKSVKTLGGRSNGRVGRNFAQNNRRFYRARTL